MLGDHYDPCKRLVLSTQNYYGTSCAALGVAAHECGHAIQDKIAFAPLRWRMAAVGATTYANQVVLWVPLIGIFTQMISPLTGAYIMVAAWSVIMLFISSPCPWNSTPPVGPRPSSPAWVMSPRPIRWAQ